jgi:hypothetical protein
MTRLSESSSYVYTRNEIFSRQVPINVRTPHTTKPLRSRWEINSLRMECGTPPSSAPRARKAAISHFRTAGHFPRTLLRLCTVGASTSLQLGERHRRGGPASEASSRAYTRGGLSGNRPPPPVPGCRKPRPTRKRGMRFPSARELPRPANGADAPAREAQAGDHAAGAHAGRSLRRAPRGPARIPPPAPRAAPLARGMLMFTGK